MSGYHLFKQFVDQDVIRKYAMKLSEDTDTKKKHKQVLTSPAHNAEAQSTSAHSTHTKETSAHSAKVKHIKAHRAEKSKGLSPRNYVRTSDKFDSNDSIIARNSVTDGTETLRKQSPLKRPVTQTDNNNTTLLPLSRKRYERERSVENTLFRTDQTNNTNVDLGSISLDDSHLESENYSREHKCPSHTPHRVYVHGASSGVTVKDSLGVANRSDPRSGATKLTRFPSLEMSSSSSVALDLPSKVIQNSSHTSRLDGLKNTDSMKSGRTLVMSDKSKIGITKDILSPTSRALVETGGYTPSVIAGQEFGIASSRLESSQGETTVRLVDPIELTSGTIQSGVSGSTIESDDHCAAPGEVCSARNSFTDKEIGNTDLGRSIHPTRHWFGQSSVEKMSHEEKELITQPARLRDRSRQGRKRRLRSLGAAI